MTGQLAPGLYDRIVSQELERELRSLRQELRQVAELESADAAERLARYLTLLAERALRAAGRAGGANGLDRQVELCNRLIETLASETRSSSADDDAVAPPPRLLLAIAEPGPGGALPFPPRPEIPLAASALLVNARDQPRIGTEIQKELRSADRATSSARSSSGRACACSATRSRKRGSEACRCAC